MACHPFLKKPYAVDLLVALLFLLFTIIVSWQVLVDVNTVLIGDDPDVYINLWADWWTLEAVTDPDATLWHTNFMFYPRGANLVYHSFSHLNTLVSLALRPLVGITAGYNLAILLNYVLGGLSMFHLARYLTGSVIAAILAGFVFAFNSHNQYQSAHPVLISIWCFPWLTLVFMRAVRENRIAWAMVAAVFVFLGTLSSTVLLILMGMWLAMLVIYMFFSSGWPRPSGRVLLSFGLVSLLLVLPLLYPLLREAFANGNSSFLVDPSRSIRMDMASIVIPHWDLWLIRGIYFGVMPCCLLLVACAWRWQKARLWFLLLVIAYLFAIGPEPRFYGEPIDVVLPWTLPLAPVLRNMYRMNILLSLGLAMLVAYGWTVLAAQTKSVRLRQFMAILVLFGIYIDYTAAPFPHTATKVSPFYTRYLDRVPDNVVLAILPTGRQEDKRYLYYQTLHEHPITGGVISRASPETFGFIYSNPLLRAGVVTSRPLPIPRDVQTHIQALADAGVGYLIFDKTLLERQEVEAWREAIPLEPVYEDSLVLAYKIGTERQRSNPTVLVRHLAGTNTILAGEHNGRDFCSHSTV